MSTARSLSLRHSVYRETLGQALERVRATLFAHDAKRAIDWKQFGWYGKHPIRFIPSGRTISSANPATGEVMPSCGVLDHRDTDRARWMLQNNIGVGMSLDTLRTDARTFMKEIGSYPRPDKTGRRPGIMFTMSPTAPQFDSFVQFKRDAWENATSLLDPSLQMNLSARTSVSDPIPHEVALAAHACGDPGVLFESPGFMRAVLGGSGGGGAAAATSPCGELFMNPKEVCVLAYLVLPSLVKDGRLIPFCEIRKLVRSAIAFLDTTVTALPDMFDESKKVYRRVGLGVVGLASMFDALGVAYTSDEAVIYSTLLSSYIFREAQRASGGKNITVGAISPTGGIAHVLGMSPGIEPHAREALHVHYMAHLNIAEAWNHCDNAVSKTVNLPEDASPGDVLRIFELAKKRNIPGITVFRDGSLPKHLYTSQACYECK